MCFISLFTGRRSQHTQGQCEASGLTASIQTCDQTALLATSTPMGHQAPGSTWSGAMTCAEKLVKRPRPCWGGLCSFPGQLTDPEPQSSGEHRTYYFRDIGNTREEVPVQEGVVRRCLTHLPSRTCRTYSYPWNNFP